MADGEKPLPKGATITELPLPPGAASGDEPTQFEKDRPGKGITTEGAGSAALEAIKRIPGGLASMFDPTSGLSGAGLTALGINPRGGSISDRLSEIPAVRAAHEVGSAYRDPVTSWWEAPVAGLGSFVGESAERARAQAAKGEGGAILGEAAVPTAMALSPLATEGIVRAAPALRSSVARAAPSVGAGAGYAVGHWPGLIIGREAGQGLRNILTPREAPPDVMPPPETFPGATSSRTPIGSAQLPSLSKGIPTPFPVVQPKTSLGVSSQPTQPNPQWFPEPRPQTPIDEPGSMWSVGRETLPSRAARGQPGALDVLTNIGDRPPLVTPRPTLGVPDPQFNALRSRYGLGTESMGEGTRESGIASPGPVSASGQGLPQGNPTPFGRLPGYKPSEKAGTLAEPRRSLGPEFEAQQREEMISRYKDIQRNPRATQEDLAEAQARLRELGAL